MNGFAIFGLLGATVLSGAVLGAALGLTGFVLLHFAVGGATRLGVQTVWNVLNEFTLTAVPLFILLGEVLVASGLARGVYRALAPFFARLPGGLLHTNIAVCTVFGAVSGSSMSVAAAVGSVAYPELKGRGYDRAAVVGTLAGGGTLGLLIPPSLSLLIYGALTDTSIGRLFLAGVLPGLMMAGLFMAIILWMAWRNPAIAPEEKSVALRAALRGLPAVLPLVALIVAVLGSLFAGLATPTEAAGVGVAAAMILGFTIGDLTLRRLGEALIGTARIFAIIAMVFIGALVLAQAISMLGLPQQMLQAIGEWGLSRWVLLLVVVAIYLVLGCFFDGLSMMIMTLPLVFPLLTGVGFDPVWLGVVVTLMIEVGMLTPPVGMNLFVLVGITNGEVDLASAARAALPFWCALLGGVLLLCLFPGIATWLPGVAFG
ncbi:C4-dicarboxylate ABC transporter permease [Falsiroseomonas bella]|uniref:TRAP transporter large permease protein n=1 Tax=Falsiroseomonas bella TaxID=2184016 RepID=A0A317FG92_9PROT|nr:TRAP transporter large permease subunit [Falsiroseomonas bella]PWS37593.1 C4-dicarboxylate ABC transporter permease [Falsiroseomonas bella]